MKTLFHSNKLSVALFALALILLSLAWRPPVSKESPGAGSERAPSGIQLSGAAAKEFLEQPSEGQSLMAAVNTARFGLKHEERAPFEEKSGAGYLAMSHDQNLNAWFADDGVTVRPTVPEEKGAQPWRLEFRLKAYGYGQQVVAVPPIVSQQVKGTRIEYERALSLSSQSSILDSKLTEWYENRAEGIEQGFTLNEPPRRPNYVSSEALRLVIAIGGDLRARVKGKGEAIELLGKDGKTALSYSKLVAQGADGKRLPGRMEASADGREIALVVNDERARYPIVIDPIIATLEQKLDAGAERQLDARFGTTVAIDGDRAVVGSWRYDVPNSALVDAGAVYLFIRSGNTWSASVLHTGDVAGGGCGLSVAISGSRIAYGCPGTSSTGGRAFIYDLAIATETELPPTNGAQAGDSYGASIAIGGIYAVVGAPFRDTVRNGTDSGDIFRFILDSNLAITGSTGLVDGAGNVSDHFGASVALSNDVLVVGAPGAFTGRGKALVALLVNDPAVFENINYLTAIDGADGDNFGQSVAISGDTAVIGAVFNDEKATDAGAAYVFVHDGGAQWHQQQKLLASDGVANDFFSVSAVAIQGNTTVVGAYSWDAANDPNGDNDERGAAYLFTRAGTVWTQQTQFLASDSDSGDNFGIGVGISGNSVIIGARHATAQGTVAAGAAYIYRLDCVPPSGTQATFIFEPPPYFSTTDQTVCPGTGVTFSETHTGNATTYQWRRNGANIGGATSSTYTINSVSPNDAGTYDVVVGNACGSDISSKATLGVHIFILNPTSKNFGPGAGTGSVAVTATGSCPWTAKSNTPFITVNAGANGSGNGTVSYTVSANSGNTSRSGTLTVAGHTFTVTQSGATPTPTPTPKPTPTPTPKATPTPTPKPTATPTATPGLVANVSTRLPVGTGDNALIEGFIVQGPSGSIKKILVRAIGPSLKAFGIPDALANPTLAVFNSNNTQIASNNNWKTTQVGGIITSNQVAEINASGLAPTNDLESAVIANLTPGSYTGVVRGANNTVGTGVVDAFDLSPASTARVANISTRGLIQPGDKLMIAGFIVQKGSVRVVISALGPSLTAFGIPNALPDTTLQLRDQNGVIVRQNDDWMTTQKVELENTGLQPNNPKEAALVATIPPGQYTAQVRGKPETTGIGVVQIFFLQ